MPLIYWDLFCNSSHSGKYNDKKVGQVKDRLKTYFEGELRNNEVKFELLIVLRNFAQNF